MKRLWTVFLVAVVLFLPAVPKEAHALNCTATISTPINFGPVDVLSGGAVVTTGQLNVSCTVVLSDLLSLVLGIAVCPGIGIGSGGASANSRLLVRDGGTETLSYQLYTNASGQTAWGGYGGGLLFGNAPLYRIPAPSVGTHVGSWPITAILGGGQSLAVPGTYRSTFSGLGGTGTEIRYGTLGNLLGCSALGATLRTSANFTVLATVAKNCLVSTADVNFGSHGILNSNISAAGAVNLTCTKGTNYAVALEAGAVPANQRMMKNGAHSVSYALYQNPQHTQLWGSAPGETASGAGSGNVASLPVYGLVPPQNTPPAGVYKDTVVITVTY